jgi:hypothetical protein
LNSNINNITITILDNGSNEFNRYYNNNENIKIIRFENNLNGPELFDRIKKYITSNYLIIFHDDDLMHPNYLRTANEIINNNPNVGLVGTLFDPFSEIPTEPFKDIIKYEKRYFPTNNKLAEYFYNDNYVHFASFIYRKDIFLKNTLNISKFGKISDRPFLLDCANGCESIIIEDKFIKYRIHSNQDSNNNKTGPYLHELLELEKLYYELLTSVFFSRSNFVYITKCFKNLLNNYKYLKKKKYFTGNLFYFISQNLKHKTTNAISLFLSFIFYCYVSLRVIK